MQVCAAPGAFSRGIYQHPFIGPDKPYQLTAAGRTIDLKGPWQYKLAATMEPLPSKTFIEWQPMGLYNGMIAPFINFAVRGFLWYQGESNASDRRGCAPDRASRTTTSICAYPRSGYTC